MRPVRDEEAEGEVPVRRLSEAENRAPVMHVALERNRLRPELRAFDVVVGGI